MKKVTLKDIAQKIGVSTALVSYVLNNQKEGRISKEVAGKIRKAATDLNYRTNQIAKSLKTNKTNTIGLIVADISNSYSSSMARIIEDEAAKNNYTVIFGSSYENADKSWKLISTFLDRQVDGLIIAPAENTETHLQYLQEHKIPFVLIDRYFPDLATNYVALDNYKSSYTATQHLVDTGYKRIGMINYDTELFQLTERTRGYTASITDNNLSFQPAWLKKIIQSTGKEGVEKAIDDLLSLPIPIDALLFASNTLAIHGLKHINSLNIKIPDELAILSFDETDAFDLFYAPVTFLKQPLEEMGKSATQLLLGIIEQEASITQINREATLVIRASTLNTKPS